MTTSKESALEKYKIKFNETVMQRCLQEFQTTDLDELVTMLTNDRLFLEDLPIMDPAYERYHKITHVLIGYITAAVTIKNGSYSPDHCIDMLKCAGDKPGAIAMRNSVKEIAKEFDCILYETEGTYSTRYILHPKNPNEENIKDIKEMIGLMIPSIYGVSRESVIQAWPTKVEAK